MQVAAKVFSIENGAKQNEARAIKMLYCVDFFEDLVKLLLPICADNWVQLKKLFLLERRYSQTLGVKDLGKKVSTRVGPECASDIH